MKTKKKEDIKGIILSEYKKGNIVVSTFEGLQVMPLNEFIKQPAEGMLYDLNRNEAVVLTFINDPKWVNDYACAKVIKKLAEGNKQRDAIIEVLEEYIKLLAESEGDLALFADTHGIKVNPKTVKRGIELRQKIETLKKEIE